MNNYMPYKHHLLARNSDAYQMLTAANKLQGTERTAALRKLDLHLKAVDRRAEELTK